MTHAPNPTWLNDFQVARNKLTPIIDGLHDLLSMRAETLTDGARRALNDALEHYTRRAGKLDNSIAALENAEAVIDALYDDGYPNVPKEDVPPAIFQELVGQKSDLDTALDQFQTDTSAQSIVTGPVTVGPKT